jgi:hypothetical protein
VRCAGNPQSFWGVMQFVGGRWPFKGTMLREKFYECSMRYPDLTNFEGLLVSFFFFAAEIMIVLKFTV